MISRRNAWNCPLKVKRLKADAHLLARVEAAERLGISLKRFDGWTPRTIYEYEDDRLVSSYPEVEWDAEQASWMLALALYRDSRCGRCNGDLDQTTDPATEGEYAILPPTMCNRCAAFEDARETYQDEPHAHSLMHRVQLRKGVKLREEVRPSDFSNELPDRVLGSDGL